MPKKSNKTREIFDEISAEDALAILRLLAKEDSKIAKRIEQIAIEYLKGVDIEDIASQVYFDLDCIEVEEVWERSGRKRNGYVEPTEMAYQMFEEALEPFVEEMKKYQKLLMFVEARNYGIGILRGNQHRSIKIGRLTHPRNVLSGSWKSGRRGKKGLQTRICRW